MVPERMVANMDLSREWQTLVPENGNDGEFADDNCTGLSLRVRRNSDGFSRTWYLLFRLPGNPKKQRHRLGPAGDRRGELAYGDAAAQVTMLTGRDGLKRTKTVIEEGRAVEQADPVDPRLNRVVVRPMGATIAEVVAAFMDEQRRERKGSKGNLRDKERLLGRWLAAAPYGDAATPDEVRRIVQNGRRPIRSFTVGDVDKIRSCARTELGQGSQSRKLGSAVRQVFEWAQESGYLDQGLPLPLPRKVWGKDGKSDRALSLDELRRVVPAIEAEQYPYRHCLMLALLTSKRVSEVTGMLRSELDLAVSVWTLPARSDDDPDDNAGRAKNGTSQELPLSDLAREIVEDALRLAPAGCPFVFSLFGKKPVSDLDDAIRRVTARSGVSDWSAHDLRRTCSTRLHKDLAVTKELVNSVLNHLPSKLDQTYMTERQNVQHVLEQWGEMIRGLRTKLLTAPQVALPAPPATDDEPEAPAATASPVGHDGDDRAMLLAGSWR
jgi:integrase